jgi:tyrosine-protein phosphatase SIW14
VVRLNGRLACVYTCAFLAACLVPVAGQSVGVRAPATIGIDLSRIDIDNFGRVDANYYRGGQPDDDDYPHLISLGIKTLIDLTSHDADPNEKAMVERAGMRYVQIPMTTHEPPTPATLAVFLGVVKDPANQPVYVHCVGGRHRTGVMTAVYRMTHDRWTADQAFKEMKQYKFGADFLHPEFKAFVYSYRADAAHTASNAIAAATTPAH